MSKLNLWRAFFHIIKWKLFTIKASTQANIYTYNINTYTHICTWREISATRFQSSSSVVDVSWRWQRFIMARVTQTCPGNNPFNLAQDKQHWANLHTKDTKLSILTRQIRENAKVLLLAGLWLLCKILALKIRPISGKWFGFRVHIALFKIQSISTQESETLLYPVTRSETLDMRGHRSHTCRQENTNPPSDRLKETCSHWL